MEVLVALTEHALHVWSQTEGGAKLWQTLFNTTSSHPQRYSLIYELRWNMHLPFYPCVNEKWFKKGCWAQALTQDSFCWVESTEINNRLLCHNEFSLWGQLN